MAAAVVVFSRKRGRRNNDDDDNDKTNFTIQSVNQSNASDRSDTSAHRASSC